MDRRFEPIIEPSIDISICTRADPFFVCCLLWMVQDGCACRFTAPGLGVLPAAQPADRGIGKALPSTLEMKRLET
jgi:hypothetical protein